LAIRENFHSNLRAIPALAVLGVLRRAMLRRAMCGQAAARR
jgi:hypothetical protein